jgi:antitoxin PrlF
MGGTKNRIACRSRLRDGGQITLPPEIRAALHVDEGDEVEFAIGEGGEVTLRGFVSVPTDQAWFYTREWQAGEREVHEAMAHGPGAVYASGDEFIDALETIDAELEAEGR